jgi:hypothetical membrane protein
MSGLGFVRFAGLVGIVAGLFGLSAVLTATFVAGNTFSWDKNALSDLGVSSVTSAANLFNYSLVIAGVLNFIFTVGFVKAYAKGMLFYSGGMLLILGEASLSLIGVFTEAYGRLHTVVSTAYFALFPLALIVVGFAFRKMNLTAKGYVSILAGTVAALLILGGITPGWHTWLGLGFAVPEIVASTIIAAWTIWMGSSLLVTKTNSQAA